MLRLFDRHTAPVTNGRLSFYVNFILVLTLLCALPRIMTAGDTERRISLVLNSSDVVPTGNEWVSLPDIRASDGAIGSFNVLSMRDRGLLQVTGERGMPALQPYFTLNGKPIAFRNRILDTSRSSYRRWPRCHDHILRPAGISRRSCPHDSYESSVGICSRNSGHESFVGSPRPGYVPSR